MKHLIGLREAGPEEIGLVCGNVDITVQAVDGRVKVSVWVLEGDDDWHCVASHHYRTTAPALEDKP